MSDRELLELAAKAAGPSLVQGSGSYFWSVGSGDAWNPLIDDGDALRLAVLLKINIEWWNSPPNGYMGRVTFDGNGVILMEYCDDRDAILRRVIVLAAATMGKEL